MSVYRDDMHLNYSTKNPLHSKSPQLNVVQQIFLTDTGLNYQKFKIRDLIQVNLREASLRSEWKRI